MKTRWTSHLKTQEEKDRFESSLRNSRFVLERLEDIMREDLSQMDSLATNMQDYQSPSWAYIQADRNGAKRHLLRYLKLLNLDQKDTNNDLAVRRPEQRLSD